MRKMIGLNTRPAHQAAGRVGIQIFRFLARPTTAAQNGRLIFLHQLAPARCKFQAPSPLLPEWADYWLPYSVQSHDRTSERRKAQTQKPVPMQELQKAG